MKSIKVVFLIILISVLISGCFEDKDNIFWATKDDLEFNAQLSDYHIDSYNDMNASVIKLNISLKNIGNKIVYIFERLVFDINIDGKITDTTNKSFYVNNPYGGYPKPNWKLPFELDPGETKYWSGCYELGFFNEEGNRFREDRILLSDNERYEILCWYIQDDFIIYSNVIEFTPKQYDYIE